MKGRARFCRTAFAQPEPRLLFRVPGDVESLQPATAEIDQILLERLIGERVFDLEVRRLAIRSFGADEEATVSAEEVRRNAITLEPGVVEIGAHGFIIGKGHRLGVVRFGECGDLFGVAGRTRLFVDESIMGSDQRVSGRRRRRLSGGNRCGEHKRGAKQQGCPNNCR
ncbi:hypothetical protein D9M68_705230 [compost metagenome]